MLSDELLQQLKPKQVQTKRFTVGWELNREAVLAAARRLGVLAENETFMTKPDAWNATINLLDLRFPGWRGYEVQSTYRRVA